LEGCVITHGFTTSGRSKPSWDTNSLKSGVFEGEKTNLFCSKKDFNQSGIILSPLWASRKPVLPPVFGIALAWRMFHMKISFPLLKFPS